MSAAKREIFEIWIGAGVVTALVLFVMLIFGLNGGGDGKYDVTARFSRADGLSTGGMVRAAGVPVGWIEELRLDDNFRAVTVLRIDRSVVLDADATASIVTDGLFGQKFIQLDIGGSDTIIGDGQEITFTEDSLVLEDLLELIISRAKQVRRNSSSTTKETQP